MSDTMRDALYGAGIDVPVSPQSVTLSSFDPESEEALVLRYGRKKQQQERLIFEFSRDPALIHQYYRIYEQEFKSVLHADYHHHDNDEHDQKGHFLIVRRGKLCVGGARLNTKTPRQPELLPIEMDGFKLEDHFPDLKHKEVSYGQIGRLCVLPEYRGGAVTRLMMWHLYRKSVALGLETIFATAPLIIARGHMKSSIAMGLKHTKVHLDIKLPEYPMCEGIRFYLMSVGLDKEIMAKAEEVTQKNLLEEKA